MLVSDKLGLVFVHVPKTGGNAIMAALRLATDDIRSRGRWHATAHEGRTTLPAWSNYRSFAFVRNPWDRMVSAYAYITRGETSFDAFVCKGQDFQDNPMWPRSAPQVRWTHNPDGQQCVDVIGRFETLAADFAEICPSAPPLERVNASDHRPYQDYYTDTIRQRVADMFAADIAAFGYTFN